MNEKEQLRKERLKETRKKYYQKNKEQILAANREWRKKNRERYREICHTARRKRVDKLREQGCINSWNVVNYGAEPKFKEIR